MQNLSHGSRRSAPFALLLSAALAASGCNIFNEGDPESARMLIEGWEGHAIQLVTTTDFDVVASQDGETRQVYVFTADTSVVTSPYDQRYSLGDRTRFYTTLFSDSTATTPVTVRILIDGGERYNRSTLFGDDTLEFVFTSR